MFSYSARSHIKRAFLATYQQLNCINGSSLNPREFGFHEEDGLLMPTFNIRCFPDDLILSCTCMKCKTIRCNCRKNGLPCCEFCKCKKLENNDCCNSN